MVRAYSGMLSSNVTGLQNLGLREADRKVHTLCFAMRGLPARAELECMAGSTSVVTWKSRLALHLVLLTRSFVDFSVLCAALLPGGST